MGRGQLVESRARDVQGGGDSICQHTAVTGILVKGDRVPRGHPEGKCVCYPELTFQEAAGLPTGEL